MGGMPKWGAVDLPPELNFQVWRQRGICGVISRTMIPSLCFVAAKSKDMVTLHDNALLRQLAFDNSLNAKL